MRYRYLRYQYTISAPFDDLNVMSGLLGIRQPMFRLGSTVWRPMTDICETPRHINIIVELAGIKAEDIDVTLYENALVVEGERSINICGEDGVYRHAEIRHGPFRLEIAIATSIDPEGVEANYDNGILRITLPKVAENNRG